MGRGSVLVSSTRSPRSPINASITTSSSTLEPRSRMASASRGSHYVACGALVSAGSASPRCRGAFRSASASYRHAASRRGRRPSGRWRPHPRRSVAVVGQAGAVGHARCPGGAVVAGGVRAGTRFVLARAKAPSRTPTKRNALTCLRHSVMVAAWTSRSARRSTWTPRFIERCGSRRRRRTDRCRRWSTKPCGWPSPRTPSTLLLSASAWQSRASPSKRSSKISTTVAWGDGRRRPGLRRRAAGEGGDGLSESRCADRVKRRATYVYRWSVRVTEKYRICFAQCKTLVAGVLHELVTGRLVERTRVHLDREVPDRCSARGKEVMRDADASLK